MVYYKTITKYKDMCYYVFLTGFSDDLMKPPIAARGMDLHLFSPLFIGWKYPFWFLPRPPSFYTFFASFLPELSRGSEYREEGEAKNGGSGDSSIFPSKEEGERKMRKSCARFSDRSEGGRRRGMTRQGQRFAGRHHPSEEWSLFDTMSGTMFSYAVRRIK